MNTLTQIKPNIEKALFLAKKQLPELICDAVNLEGINYTLPEVQTLLDGVTVGGKKQQDERITKNQADAWKVLFEMIAQARFRVGKKTAYELHSVASAGEALSSGVFRTGKVFIAGTAYLPPPAEKLNDIWDTKISTINLSGDNQQIYTSAISVFLRMARYQFFYDVNKRMGRFMMNGVLLSKGLPVINLPAKHQLEFNELMLEFYSSGDELKMQRFMLTCLDQRIIDIMAE